ncbi:MAG: Asp-tRNA(Asn)/Glu-tRNA(Gln) amidotransferase subunit GatB [Rickettsiales bacterium]|jgi:aspartyl-tRNA(Asn)/glutamyl-tRNA(Gln) amidotransferase subunit B|nr:Asp-tRNA(Asn)/Glu-tRNA(Gln) amidotransferase subunit GatB [Rickettsiales bacterium]
MYTIKGKTGEWELVIALETHIEVLSNSKLFSGASADYNPTVSANTQVSMVDAAMPGMLPVLNRECVDQAIRFGLGINADITRRSIFTRKQYFYPDLPQGYQITQPADRPPIVGRGWVEIAGDDGNPKKIFIERAHLEQDAGKNIHDMNPSRSFVDLNRAGVCLLEIVNFIDIHNREENSFISSPDEAERYLRTIREIARATGVSKANMEEGSMRADVNVSVRLVGEKAFRTRTETKNMVSFKFIKTAIEFEARRQIEIYESGGQVSQDTMHYNQNTGKTSVMRSKADALDYRHFPDPDLMPLIVSDEQIEKIRSAMPELPAAKRTRYVGDFGITEYDAARLTESVEISDYFESAIGGKPENAKLIANWVLGDLAAHPEYAMPAAYLAELVEMISANEINGKQAKDLFIKMLEGESGNPRSIADKFGMKQITDTGAIESAVNAVIAANPAQVEQYRSGKTGILGFLVGAVMKATGGKANPAVVNQIMTDKLKV